MTETLLHTDRTIQVIVACSGADQRREIIALLDNDRQLLVRSAADWPELRGRLESDPCDVVVVTNDAGDMSGFEINNRIKTFVADRPAIVMVDSARDPHSVLKALRCGFADYVPADRKRVTDLHTAVVRAAGSASAAREQAQRLRDLERMAQRDSTTGLVNWHFLSERLDQLAEINHRYGTSFATILIRVDHLEQLCSVFGCKVGDAVLVAFAHQLRAAARKSGTFGRLNKDTFLYLLDQQITAGSIAGACARLRDTLAFSLKLDNVSLALSASVSAATFPEDGGSIAELLLAAEQGLASDPALTSMTSVGAFGLPSDDSSPTPQLEQSTNKNAILSDPVASRSSDDGPDPVSPASPVDVSTTSVSNRRHAMRHRCLKTGILVFNGGFSTVNCRVRDLSDAGARIEVEGNLDMRQTFELRLVESGHQFKVEKRWHRGNRYGLRFVT